MTQIGVCSWSLRPTGVEDLVRKVRECGLNAVQIALDPIRHGDWLLPQVTGALREYGVTILSGMMAMRGEDYSTLESIRRTGGVRLDEHWAENLAAARANAGIARQLGINLVTFHAGFLPHDRTDPLRQTMIDRLRQFAEVFGGENVEVAFETGQETAETLLDVLREFDHPRIGVNYDPANMILYGMGDPIASFEALAGHVRQIHIKDANPTKTPGEWGREMPVGNGAVDWPAFMRLVIEKAPNVNLVIERESGTHSIDDIRAARQLIRKLRFDRSE
jgi:L-ribulose-5-phosphate 3-epimerase